MRRSITVPLADQALCLNASEAWATTLDVYSPFAYIRGDHAFEPYSDLEDVVKFSAMPRPRLVRRLHGWSPSPVTELIPCDAMSTKSRVRTAPPVLTNRRRARRDGSLGSVS